MSHWFLLWVMFNMVCLTVFAFLVDVEDDPEDQQG